MRKPRTFDDLVRLLPEAAIETVGDREELVIYTGWSVAADGETLEPMHDDDEGESPRANRPMRRRPAWLVGLMDEPNVTVAPDPILGRHDID